MKPSRVLKLLSKLDVAKGTGLDQICNKILKFVASLIYRQLTDLFNLSLKSLEFQFLMTGSWQKFSLGSKWVNVKIPIIMDQYQPLTVSKVFES